jgi:hypothetical protein
VFWLRGEQKLQKSIDTEPSMAIFQMVKKNFSFIQLDKLHVESWVAKDTFAKMYSPFLVIYHLVHLGIFAV